MLYIFRTLLSKEKAHTFRYKTHQLRGSSARRGTGLHGAALPVRELLRGWASKFSSQGKYIFFYVWCQVLTRLAVVMILQCVQRANHYVVHLKLT